MAHRRSILLIDKKFQLRFSFYVCSWIFVLSMIYPLIIQHLFEMFLHRVTELGVVQSAPDIAAVQSEVQKWLVVMQAGFLGLTFAISLFVSHRIAGPIYKLRKALAEGKVGPIQFRKYDYFQELADEYNTSQKKIEGAIQQLESLAQKVSSDQKTDIQKAIQQLRSGSPSEA